MDYHSSVRVLLSPNILTNLKPSDISHLDERVKRSGDQMPVMFLPEESETQCVAQNRMSSFGFLAFVVQSINAVVNVANNINDNNNNRNNNNNDNNNNQVCHSDTNLYNIGCPKKSSSWCWKQLAVQWPFFWTPSPLSNSLGQHKHSQQWQHSRIHEYGWYGQIIGSEVAPSKRQSLWDNI